MLRDLTSEVFRNQWVFVTEGELDLEHLSGQLKKFL